MLNIEDSLLSCPVRSLIHIVVVKLCVFRVCVRLFIDARGLSSWKNDPEYKEPRIGVTGKKKKQKPFKTFN